MLQKIKDFWWIFIEMGVPLKEIRKLIQNKFQEERFEMEMHKKKLLKELTDGK